MRNIAIGIRQRVNIFIKRAGGIILVLSILLWFLASFPSRPSIRHQQETVMNKCLYACIPGSQLMTIPNAHHMALYENPAAFNDALPAFLARR